MTKEMNSLYDNNIWTDNLELFTVKYIKFTGVRQRGRLRKGWREEVERDLQVLGVRRCKELVIDRKKWRGTVQQAKAHSRL
jgi:hypothetical protein